MVMTEKELSKLLKDLKQGSTTSLEDFKRRNVHWCDIYQEKSGNTIMHYAAQFGLIDIVNYLLTNFHPKIVDCKNRDDKTPLHEAAQFSQFQVCEILLEHGANVNALKRSDWTPLMLACTKTNDNSLKIIDLFLKYGGLLNYQNKDGWTCLHLISREGNISVLNLLIENGLKVRQKTKNGRTALHIAALHDNLEIVKRLICLGLDVNDTDNCGNTPLHEAVLGNNLKICKILIKHGAKVDLRNNSDYGLIHLAASEGHINILQFLVNELKCDINQSNQNCLTGLHCAARNRKIDAYEYLVKNGALETLKDNFDRQPMDYYY